MALIPSSPILDKAAIEVGHISFLWAKIESLVGEFVAHLMGVGADTPEANILDGNMDIRSKIQAAKGLVYLRHFDRQWLEDAIAMLDHIDNYLRPKRNYVVHSSWFSPYGRSLSSRTRKTKIIRPQAFQLELETEQKIPVRLGELRRLRLDLQETWLGMLPIYWFMMSSVGEVIDPELTATITWRQYLRHVGLGNPLRNVTLVKARLRRQRKS